MGPGEGAELCTNHAPSLAQSEMCSAFCWLLGVSPVAGQGPEPACSMGPGEGPELCTFHAPSLARAEMCTAFAGCWGYPLWQARAQSLHAQWGQEREHSCAHFMLPPWPELRCEVPLLAAGGIPCGRPGPRACH